MGAGLWLWSLFLLYLFESVHLVLSIRKIGSDGIVAVLSGYVSLFCLVYVVNDLVLPFGILAVGANALLLMVYGILSAYLLSANGHLDYAVISENYYWASVRSSLKVVWESLRWEPLALSGLMSVSLFLPALFPPDWAQAWPAPRGDLSLAAAGTYLLILALPQATHDELMHFFKSLRRYHGGMKPRRAGLPEIRLADDAYPFLKQGVQRHGIDLIKDRGSLPHVFLVMVESFNAAYVEKTSPEGRPYTPVFNRLIGRGLYVERFYANGVQTAAGQGAAFFSLLPGLRGNLFNNYRYLKLQSLAALLGSAGYRTLFFQADRHLDLENTRPMLKKHGFDDIGRVWDHLEKEDRDCIWGWGPEDQVLYRRFFRHLDAVRERSGPCFSVLATINNHMRFDVPEKKRLLYPKPSSLRQRYANSLRLADRDLEVFFAELRKRPYLDDAIVIVTGDHSFPTGDHGIESNEIGFYEESFRTPLLMIWEGRLGPRRITESVHSQIDIAPTILDLLGLDVGPNHFQGASVFGGDPGRPAIFIQPYNGVYIGMATGRHKYARRLSTGEEFLFDLMADPREERNLAATGQADERLAYFRGFLPYVFLNQHLIEHNRIWKQA